MLHWCLWQKRIFLQSETCKNLKIELLLIISPTSVRNMVKENVYWKFREWEELSISKSADRDPVHGKGVQGQSDQLLQMLNSRFIRFSVRLGRGPVIPLVWFHLVSISDAGQKTRAFQTEINKKKAWTIEAGQSAAKPTLTYHRADAGLLKRGIVGGHFLV